MNVLFNTWKFHPDWFSHIGDHKVPTTEFAYPLEPLPETSALIILQSLIFTLCLLLCLAAVMPGSIVKFNFFPSLSSARPTHAPCALLSLLHLAGLPWDLFALSGRRKPDLGRGSEYVSQKWYSCRWLQKELVNGQEEFFNLWRFRSSECCGFYQRWYSYKYTSENSNLMKNLNIFLATNWTA